MIIRAFKKGGTAAVDGYKNDKANIGGRRVRNTFTRRGLSFRNVKQRWFEN